VELRQLKHFREIVQCASFGQAADKLNITQPALSKSIRNLEQSLGVLLLERHPSGVTPTDYGNVFLEYATLVISELDRAVDQLAEMKGQGRGVVRVGAGTTMLQYLMPAAVKLFMAGPDGGRVTFSEGLRADLVAQLRRGEIDVIVGSVNPDAEDDDMRQELVLEDRITVVADKAHPLASVATVTVEQIAKHKWVLPDTSEAEGDRLTRTFRAAGCVGPDCAVRTGSSIFMASLLKDSEYLSYLPRALILSDADYAHLKPLDVEEPIWPRVVVGATYRRRGVMLAPTRRFINRLKDVGKDLQPYV
jgi:LysR family transcriptional regulator, regulator of abg operon